MEQKIKETKLSAFYTANNKEMFIFMHLHTCFIPSINGTLQNKRNYIFKPLISFFCYLCFRLSRVFSE